MTVAVTTPASAPTAISSGFRRSETYFPACSENRVQKLTNWSGCFSSFLLSPLFFTTR